MNNLPIIIGIAGYKGSGKDECCKRIREHFPSSERIAFADALKDEVAFHMHVSRDFIEKHKDNFRLILQGWGTDYRRKLFGDNYWIGQWLHRIRIGTKDVVVVPDVRFLNEVEAVRKLKGYVFKVVRRSVEDGDSHVSENELKGYTKFDRTIDNNGSIQQLHVNVDVALEMCGLYKNK